MGRNRDDLELVERCITGEPGAWRQFVDRFAPTVRALARRHGRDLIRVNAVSSGPVTTKAAKAIPHFAFLSRTWRKSSPLPWDTFEDKQEVANAAVFLLSPYAKKITGQVIKVDGGASIMGGELLPNERIFPEPEVVA